MTSAELVPRTGHGTPHGGKVRMCHHMEEGGLALHPHTHTHTLNLSSMFRVGALLQGLRSSLMADLDEDPLPSSIFIFKKSSGEVFTSFP